MGVMAPVRKLAVPAVLTFVVVAATALVVPSCSDDDGGPLADSQQAPDARSDGSPVDARPIDAGMPDMPVV
jgi:hypothetical protein